MEIEDIERKNVHSSLANPSIQFFHALYKYYPIKLLAEYREFNKMMGIIIQEEVWNIIEAYGHEMTKNELFLIKKAKLTTFLTLFVNSGNSVVSP